MHDAGCVSTDQHTEPHLAGVSPSQPAALVVGLPLDGGDHPPLPIARKKPATCLDESQVLDATARVLRERGYDGTTIRAIAKQLSCAVGSIYRYFPDKRALLDCVCQRRFEAVAEQAELRAGVMTSIQRYARVASEQPELYRLMFWLASVGKQQMGEALPAVTRRIIAGWTESLGSQTRAKSLWAQLHGCIMLGMAPEQAITMLDLSAVPEPQTTAHAGPSERATPPVFTQDADHERGPSVVTATGIPH